MGGTVRDLLLARKARDLDLCIDGDARAFAASLANRLDGTLVALDEDRATYRVVPPGLSAGWIDVVGQRGTEIEDDLAERDFTANALAIPFEEFVTRGTEGRVLDPLGGLVDLRARRLRMVSERNLTDDPLRGLRGVRVAAELRGEIEPATRDAIRKHAPLLARVAAERVREELLRLFEAPRTAFWVRGLDWLGFTDLLWPELAACRDVTQNAYHHLDVFDHSVMTLERAEGIARRPSRFFGIDGLAITESLACPLGGARVGTYLKMVSLLHDVGKPVCRTVETDGRVRFIGHDQAGAKQVTAWATRWRFSGEAVSALCDWVFQHLRAGHVSGEGGPSRRTAYRFFRDLGPLAEGAIVLSFADRLAARGEAYRDVRRAQLASLQELLRLRREELSKPRPVRILTGTDLIQELSLPPGPMFGELLAAVEEAHALGEVRDREEALTLVRKMLSERETNRGS